VQLDFQQLRELLSAFDETTIAELTLKSGDFELALRKSDRGTAVTVPVAPAAVAEVPATAAAAPTPSPPPTDPKWVEIVSPMVGTFYRSPAPDEDPFVEVGDRIETGQTVCIIEAMKLMNEVEAETSGQIMEILVENGEPVEYQQPLMRVQPSRSPNG